MGANPSQALAFLAFLAAFVFFAAALFQGGGILLILIGLVLLAGSVALFLKVKPLEHLEG
jgi:membrane protein implicated in regulation of membrane protease activity